MNLIKKLFLLTKNKVAISSAACMEVHYLTFIYLIKITNVTFPIRDWLLILKDK